MAIIAKASSSNFVPPPEGQWPAVCCDVVDLGELEVNFGGKKSKKHKIKIVWQLAEVRQDGKPHRASKRYTLSLHEKAALRKDLESWRGRKFTAAELQGFDVETVLSVPCFLNIIREQASDGNEYSNVTAIMRLPKGFDPPVIRDYVRECDRKDESHDMSQEPPDHPDGIGFGITDDDVPF